MARYGESFLNAMANPAYMQGMFTAAQQVGAAPRAYETRKQLATATPDQLAQLELQKAVKSGDPAAVRQAQQNIINSQATAISAGVSAESTAAELDAAAQRIRSIPNLSPAGLQRAEALEERARRIRAAEAAAAEKAKPKDYGVTKQEEDTYKALMDDADVEKAMVLKEGGWSDFFMDEEVDVDQDILFDEAERLRAADTTLSKKEALIKAINSFRPEQAQETKQEPNWYNELSDEDKAKVDELRAYGTSDEEIRKAL